MILVKDKDYDWVNGSHYYYHLENLSLTHQKPDLTKNLNPSFGKNGSSEAAMMATGEEILAT